MIKPTSITALQAFFFIANIDSTVTSIEQAREGLQATSVERLRSLHRCSLPS
jgi:hypothetical protein